MNSEKDAIASENCATDVSLEPSLTDRLSSLRRREFDPEEHLRNQSYISRLHRHAACPNDTTLPYSKTDQMSGKQDRRLLSLIVGSLFLTAAWMIWVAYLVWLLVTF